MKVAIDFSSWIFVESDHIPDAEEAQEWILKAIAGKREGITFGAIQLEGLNHSNKNNFQCEGRSPCIFASPAQLLGSAYSIIPPRTHFVKSFL